MSRTFIAVRVRRNLFVWRGGDGTTQKDIERVRALWQAHADHRLPRWYVLLWMWLHGWRVQNLFTIKANVGDAITTLNVVKERLRVL